MPRYFFHVRNGFDLSEDEKGVELPSIMIGKREAEEAARDILGGKVRAGEVMDGQEFEIQDRWGNRLRKIPFRSIMK